MAATKATHKCVVSNGNKKDGQGKFWKTVGYCFVREDGTRYLKFDLRDLAGLLAQPDPDGEPWSGYVNLFVKEEQGAYAARSAAAQNQQPASNYQPKPGEEDEEDDIPF